MFDLEKGVALRIAVEAHAGQKDWFGVDYIRHPVAVSSFCISSCARIAALLHDVVEDTHVGLDDLRGAGIDQTIVEAVDCLTKRKGETLDEYYNRVAQNDVAIEVKFADMRHNSDAGRFPEEKQEQGKENSKKYLSRAKKLAQLVGEQQTYKLVSEQTYAWLYGLGNGDNTYVSNIANEIITHLNSKQTNESKSLMEQEREKYRMSVLHRYLMGKEKKPIRDSYYTCEGAELRFMANDGLEYVLTAICGNKNNGSTGEYMERLVVDCEKTHQTQTIYNHEYEIK